MVKSGHAATPGQPIREVRFRNPRLDRLGLDTLTLAQLRSKAPPEHFARPEKLTFFQLLHITGGKGVHEVDFLPYRLRKGTLIVTKPGQVQQYHLNPSLKGRLLLMDSAFLEAPQPPLALADWPAEFDLPSWLDADVARTIDLAARETSVYRGDVLTARLLYHAVLALLLEIQRFAMEARPGQKPLPVHLSDLMRLLKAEVESAFHRERSVKYYARRLGYSEKTLTRACLEAEGRTAKAMIDERVTLEAKRLLAHSRSSPTEIGCQLGFSEATNFVKFFKRMTRVTPSAFRTSRAASPSARRQPAVSPPR